MPMGSGTRDMVLPRGEEGLSPGEDHLLDEKARQGLWEEVGRVKALEEAQRTARGEARAAVAEAMGERNTKLDAFRSFLGSVQELVKGGEGSPLVAGRTEVVLKLFRLVENGGPKATQSFQTQITYGAEEALSLGDPDFEGRTMGWARQTGRFGKYQWRILGWADGENTLDTTYTVNVEQPEGYSPPMVPRAAEPDPMPAPPVDPMAKVREGLSFIEEVKKVIGGGNSGNEAASVARMAGEMDGRRKAEEEHRAVLRELETRHREALEGAERTAYKRGYEEGDRKARWELEDQIRELKWKMREDQGPDMLDKLVSFAGGPEGVSNLVSAVVGALNRKPAAAPQPPKPQGPLSAPRPGMTPAPIAPFVPPIAPIAPPAPVAQLSEPTRAEHLEAMEDLAEALALLEEYEQQNPGQNPSIPQALDLLRQIQAQGQADGPLGAWWQGWTGQWGRMVEQILNTAESPEGEGGMDLDGFKKLLVQRLDEGAEDDAILAEARGRLAPEQLAEWRPLLAALPRPFLGLLLGAPRHQDRLPALVEAFVAG